MCVVGAAWSTSDPLVPPSDRTPCCPCESQVVTFQTETEAVIELLLLLPEHRLRLVQDVVQRIVLDQAVVAAVQRVVIRLALIALQIAVQNEAHLVQRAHRMAGGVLLVKLLALAR